MTSNDDVTETTVKNIVEMLCYFLTDSNRRIPELTDQMVERLSKCITSEEELRALAINGLGRESENVKKHQANYPKAITTAAYNLLIEWRNGQMDQQSAYKELCKGLKSSNLELYIASVLKPKDQKPSVSNGSKKEESKKDVKRPRSSRIENKNKRVKYF